MGLAALNMSDWLSFDRRTSKSLGSGCIAGLQENTDAHMMLNEMVVKGFSMSSYCYHRQKLALSTCLKYTIIIYYYVKGM